MFGWILIGVDAAATLMEIAQAGSIHQVEVSAPSRSREASRRTGAVHHRILAAPSLMPVIALLEWQRSPYAIPVRLASRVPSPFLASEKTTRLYRRFVPAANRGGGDCRVVGQHTHDARLTAVAFLGATRGTPQGA